MDVVDAQCYEVRDFLCTTRVTEAEATAWARRIIRKCLTSPMADATCGGCQEGLMQRVYWLTLQQPAMWPRLIAEMDGDVEVRRAYSGYPGLLPAEVACDDLTLSSDQTAGTLLRDGVARGLPPPPAKSYREPDGRSCNWYGPVRPGVVPARRAVNMFTPIVRCGNGAVWELFEAIGESARLAVSRAHPLLENAAADVGLPGVGFWFAWTLVSALPCPCVTDQPGRETYVHMLYRLLNPHEFCLRTLTVPADGANPPADAARRIGNLAWQSQKVNCLIHERIASLVTGSPRSAVRADQVRDYLSRS
jgi:hypothetical protein